MQLWWLHIFMTVAHIYDGWRDPGMQWSLNDLVIHFNFTLTTDAKRIVKSGETHLTMGIRIPIVVLSQGLPVQENFYLDS